jgi:ribosomal protein S18 acetylase RimI-like enzyme
MTLYLSNKELTLQECTSDDHHALAEIYKSTRRKEMEQAQNWTDHQKEAFLNQQFTFQHEYYQKNYVGAAFYVIIYKKTIIGRLYIHPDFERKSMRIIDIAILPEWQNKGFGTGILKDIQQEGKLRERPVTIHVESFNPAMNLYKRLGFKKISETNGVYFLFEWTP